MKCVAKWQMIIDVLVVKKKKKEEEAEDFYFVAPLA